MAWPTPDLVATATAERATKLTLAFVTTGAQQCKAAWGGITDASSGFLSDQIARLRAGGRDVIISFGGANGVELAQSCGDATSLASAYQAVIDTYGLTSIDFDVEGGAVAAPASVTRRSEAIATLQSRAAKAGKRLDVSLTLPALPQGLTADGVTVVRSARDAGASLRTVNIMAMDYGAWAAPNPAGRMGQYALDAAAATQAQMATLWPGASAATLRALVGVTPMIGQNDASDEVFTLDDARAFVAGSAGIGRVAFWSANRDRPCQGGAKTYADPTCSGVTDPAGAFGAVLSTAG